MILKFSKVNWSITKLTKIDKFEMNFKENAVIFYAYFGKQWSLIKNNSKLPSHIHYLTGNCLSSATFSQYDIAKTFQILDPNKAHGHYNIIIQIF